MSNKKKLKEGSETTAVSGHFGGKNDIDPYKSGKSLNKRGKEKKPWYMKTMDEVTEAVKSSLYESKRKALQEARGVKKSSYKVSLPVAGGRAPRRHIDEFKGITNLYQAPVVDTAADFKAMIRAEGGLGSLLFTADGKPANALPDKEKPFEDGELAQHEDFNPKVEKSDTPEDQ